MDGGKIYASMTTGYVGLFLTLLPGFSKKSQKVRMVAKFTTVRDSPEATVSIRYHDKFGVPHAELASPTRRI